MVMRTTLFNNIGISANANFSLYGLNSKGGQTGTFYLKQNGKLMRLNQFAVSLDFSVSDFLKGKEQKDIQPVAGQAGAGVSSGNRRPDAEPDTGPDAGSEKDNSQFDEYGYMKFRCTMVYGCQLFPQLLKSLP